MADLALTAFTALAPVAGGGAGAATLASAGSGALSALQGVTTVGSQIASLFSGGAGLLTGLQNSRMLDLNAHAEELASQAKAIEIKRNLVKQIGDSRVAFAAGGMDIAGGSAIEGSLTEQAAFQTGLARTSGDMAAISKRMQAANAELSGYSSLAEGIGKAASTGAKGSLDISRRG